MIPPKVTVEQGLPGSASSLMCRALASRIIEKDGVVKNPGAADVEYRSMSEAVDQPPQAQSLFELYLSEVQLLLARQRRVEALLQKQDMLRHDLVEGLVHRQHLVELHNLLRRPAPPAGQRSRPRFGSPARGGPHRRTRSARNSWRFARTPARATCCRRSS
jgi:hypothetical protein